MIRKTKAKSVLFQRGVTVPDGTYPGSWSGTFVTFTCEAQTYSFYAEDISILVSPVTVTVRGSEIEAETLENNDD
jgi:hypothetical protein